jgi:hypothetical protein
MIDGNLDGATREGVSFVQSFFGPLHQLLPE